MRPVLTPAESARLDASSSVPESVLLDRAGLGVAIAAVAMGAGYGTKVAVLAGTGNNGGDGWVAARHLRERGADVVVHCLGYPRGDSSPRRAAAIAAMRHGVKAVPLGATAPADLVVDALFGAGFRGEVPEAVVPWTRHPAPVLAVDFPSGLDGTTGEAGAAVFTAARTVTFHTLKTGHLVGRGPDLCGEVQVVDIGLDGGIPEWVLCDDADALLPPRERRAHKWSAGAVAVAGGSPGIAGAALLTARAALAFGAGSVRLLAPGGLVEALAATEPGVTTAAIGNGHRLDDPVALLAAADRFDVLALGPGLGPDAGEVVAAVLDRWDRPLVLDADALPVAAMASLQARSAPTVLTPHAGEFRALTGEPAGPDAAARLAAATGAVVVLKGAPTFVMGAERWVVTSGSADLATIGTGDVLTGMIAALLARGMGPEEAARAAAHHHGRAGRSRAAVTSVTAMGLVGEIGRFAW